MSSSTISSEEINELNLKRYEGKIHLVTQEKQLERALKKIHQHKVVGFDTETKPAFKKGQFNDVSLVQIAIPGEVFLIRINITGITDALADLLQSKKILKIGVALRDDIKDLQKLRPFEPGEFVELNQLVKDIGIESNGLRKLTAIILGFRISKNAQISNWESEQLTEKQITYAATDAWVCLEMYRELERRGYVGS